MTAGRLVYLFFHRPKGLVKRSIREGGPIEQWKTERGKREMEAAAWQLPSIGPRDEETKRLELGEQKSEVRDHISEIRSAASGPPFEIHMLVGTRFWFMAAYALVSLQRQIDRVLHIHLYDDGSLQVKQREKLETLARQVTFHDRAGIDARIAKHLPEESFPFIRERLRNYPNLKKLTDPHVGSTGPKLVMDADVLFFGRPKELLQWFHEPENILCATDVTESYGYSRGLMKSLAGREIPGSINVGITGLNSQGLAWDTLEDWCKQLMTREGKSYYLEQALVAMLCATRSFTQLDLTRYITGPRDEQVLTRQGVMQHYVDLSKKEYFRSAWEHFVAKP